MAINDIEFASIVGMTFANVENIADEKIVFTDSSGQRFTMYHEQDCCESVTVESIAGDLSDLIGQPILMAEVATSSERPADAPVPEWTNDSETWTFYKLATIKGYVDIRWYGSSNGYYSESVEFVRGDSRVWS